MKTKLLQLLFLFSILSNAQIVNIPDANFKSRLLLSTTTNSVAQNAAGNNIKIDANSDNEIQVSEALQVIRLQAGSASITSLVGIQSFANLQFLFCEYNQLTTLDLSNLNYLRSLYCQYNQINSLTLSNLINLRGLYCNNNQLTALDLNGLTDLQTVNCSNNQITILSFTGLINLNTIDCQSNQLINLDFRDSNILQNIYCTNNQLESLNIKNGTIEANLSIGMNPNIKYICADEGQLSTVQSLISTNSYANCHVNTYCSFTPGGPFYEIQGSNKFDENTNGCDALDVFVPNLKFNINSGYNGSAFGSFVGGNTGSNNFAIQSGTHIISPIFENPSYFNAFPSSATVSFPSSPSPFIQDFCLTANGSHPDLEILALPFTPITHAGSNVVYKIIYKNNGSITQSGSINLFFDDSILDLVQSIPTIDSQTTNNLNWNFSNLKPFETRVIYITLNTNSPIDVPPLFTGYYLNYTATISSSANDENMNDNVFHFRQVIDMDCGYNYVKNIKGQDITPEEVGKYVYYMIGIENTGTASAQNIVAKNIIDTSKFDISTLQIIESSHPLKTKITSTNKIEFIFENINLQNTSNANRGYVAYKIKTNSNLVVGDSFSNQASIYFDYNFPIETENTTTNIVNSLGLQENELLNTISIYPNPVKDFLNFKTEKNISKVEVYDISGRILSSNSVRDNTIDLSELKTGNYFLKLFTEKGITNTKIIKE